MLWVYPTLTLILFARFHVEAKAILNETVEENKENIQLKNLDVVKNLEDCFIEPPISEEEFNLQCTAFISTIYRCWKTFTIVFEPSLNPEEKPFYHFYLETFNSSAEHQCQRGAAHVKQLVKNLKQSECLPLGETLKLKCGPEFKLLLEFQESNFVLNSSGACGDLASAKKCVVGIVKERCNGDVVGNFLEDVLEHHLTRCSHA